MPQPTSAQAHTDTTLTNVSIAHMQSVDNYAATKVAPVIGVQKQTDLVRIYTRADLLRSDAARRGPGSRIAESGYGMSTTTYTSEVWGLGHLVDEQTAANYDEPGDAEEDAVKALTQDLLIQREAQFVTKIFDNSLWGTSSTPAAGDKWDVATSDPREQIHTAKETVLAASGFIPNVLCVDYRVHNALLRHPLLRDQIKYTDGAGVDSMAIAKFFDVEKYVVAKATRNSGPEGGTASYGLVSSPDALLVFAPNAPGLMVPAGCYNFVWDGLQGFNQGLRVSRYEDIQRRGTMLEVEMTWGFTITASEMGYFFNDAVT